MLQHAEDNLLAAERQINGTVTSTANERAEVRTKIALGWIQLAKERNQ